MSLSNSMLKDINPENSTEETEANFIFSVKTKGTFENILVSFPVAPMLSIKSFLLLLVYHTLRDSKAAAHAQILQTSDILGVGTLLPLIVCTAPGPNNA